jgi:hypothetical protein
MSTPIKSQSPETPPPLPALDEVDLAAATSSGPTQWRADPWLHSLGGQDRIALLGEASIRMILTERVFLSFRESGYNEEMFKVCLCRVVKIKII